MSHVDYRTLLDRGRKAGLGTHELYQALATRPAASADPGNGQPDVNGYVPAWDRHGRRIYLPSAKR